MIDGSAVAFTPRLGLASCCLLTENFELPSKSWSETFSMPKDFSKQGPFSADPLKTSSTLDVVQRLLAGSEKVYVRVGTSHSILKSFTQIVQIFRLLLKISVCEGYQLGIFLFLLGFLVKPLFNFKQIKKCFKKQAKNYVKPQYDDFTSK